MTVLLDTAIDTSFDSLQVSGEAGSSAKLQGSLDKIGGVETYDVIDTVDSPPEPDSDIAQGSRPYRLYKQRFVGLFALCILTAVGSFSHPWFGPIARDASKELGFSLNQINWLGIAVNLAILPSSIFVPFMCKRYGLKITCCAAGVVLLVSGWIRYAGTVKSLSPGGAYALILIGQILAGFTQAVFQTVGPRYSETWFDLKGRTTATMLVSIANPVGGAIAQLISPRASTARSSILILSVICTIAAPGAIFIGSAPPTPPTFAASRSPASLSSLVRALLGREPNDRPTYMSVRERIDFSIIALNFGVIVGVVQSFTLLTGQNFGPYGYSSGTSGLLGATILIAGLVTSCISGPLFDRVLTRHMALTIKILCPILAAAWISLIWAVKPHDAGALFAIMAIIGACSIPLLPIVMELIAEITRNASGSPAILLFAANVLTVAFVLAEGALRAGPDANPPKNMHRAFIFQGVLVGSVVVTTIGLRGKPARREMDERKLEESRQAVAMLDA